MFPTSTQCKHWMFSSEDELNKLREKANVKHVQIYGKNIAVGPVFFWILVVSITKFQDNLKYEFFLTPEEERLMLRRYELHLRDFCKRFQPPMPRAVVGTAFHYFKRFYINNSVMNYHPKEIMFVPVCYAVIERFIVVICRVTCVYLACKVEEFNVSIIQFVANIKGDREKASDIILNNELLLMEQLNFHLTIHNPFRPVEGLLIDIKVNIADCPIVWWFTQQFQTRTNLSDPERLRQGTDSFLEKAFLTDVILLYSPSQIALAAVLYSASKLQENLDSYVTDTLFGTDGQGKLNELIEAVRSK